jgi:hypothetical protein
MRVPSVRASLRHGERAELLGWRQAKHGGLSVFRRPLPTAVGEVPPSSKSVAPRLVSMASLKSLLPHTSSFRSGRVVNRGEISTQITTSLGGAAEGRRISALDRRPGFGTRHKNREHVPATGDCWSPAIVGAHLRIQLLISSRGYAVLMHSLSLDDAVTIGRSKRLDGRRWH